MAPVFFPLDEELALLPGTLSPYLHEAVVRLGTWMPFERVPGELAFFCRMHVSVETARRLTEGSGAALVVAETAELERLERELPEPPAGPAIQQLSVDGAMAPLRGGEWAEVKTMALGAVGQRTTREGEQVAHTTDLTYFSRLTDAEQFGRLATIATHAAGTARAGIVCGVVDGAVWQQGFIDLHRPDAVRILDFPHAAEHVSMAAHAVFGPESPVATAWLDQQLTELKTGDPDRVLDALAALAHHPDASPDAQAICQGVSGYLTTRRAQIAYATFRQAGYPIGDGIVESGNKLVMEARLKGSGMRWARANVTPMVALRACACSDHWEDGWHAIDTRLRAQARAHRQSRRATHRQERQSATPPDDPVAPAAVPAPPHAPAAPQPAREKLVVDGRPTAAHPWRRFRLPGSHELSPRAKS